MKEDFKALLNLGKVFAPLVSGDIPSTCLGIAEVLGSYGKTRAEYFIFAIEKQLKDSKSINKTLNDLQIHITSSETRLSDFRKYLLQAINSHSVTSTIASALLYSKAVSEGRDLEFEETLVFDALYTLTDYELNLFYRLYSYQQTEDFIKERIQAWAEAQRTEPQKENLRKKAKESMESVDLKKFPLAPSRTVIRKMLNLGLLDKSDELLAYQSENGDFNNATMIFVEYWESALRKEGNIKQERQRFYTHK